MNMPKQGYHVYWTLNMPADLAIWCEKWCENEGLNRSQLVKQLLKAFMDKEEWARGDHEYKAAKGTTEKPVEKSVDDEADAVLSDLLGKSEQS